MSHLILVVSENMDSKSLCQQLTLGQDVTLIVRSPGQGVDKLLEELKPDLILIEPSPNELKMITQALNTLGDQISFGSLALDNRVKKAFVGDEVLNLTQTEFRLIWYLAKNGARSVTREDLDYEVLNLPRHTESRALDVHIFSIRKKLLRFGVGVHTERGVGYRLELKPQAVVMSQG